MTFSHQIIIFVFSSLLINILPGPDMIFIISRTLSHHSRGGYISVAGISTGLLVYTIAVATGLSLLLTHSNMTFQIIKWLGAIYLAYLGIKLFFFQSNQVAVPQEKPSAQHDLTVFRQAFITNLLNPKILIFFNAFLPQFVMPTLGHTFLQFILLGFIFILTGTSVNILVVLASSRAKANVEKINTFKVIHSKIAGLVLIALALKLAFEKLI